ncbi:hypothetical protein MUA90_12470 [Staphylococcus sp. IVB6181]|uniref:hypothetical protein n=1 Tax=Staphylococcus sp. IVB6181 TaxID=2929481 RepID=UPI0021CFEF50|nr:hypothetical protein [Staphylococcus sp. IVB6181]UXV34806.1 hypothetical protein MUA90_12470 [Staphylococcus sp. IVB6181]
MNDDDVKDISIELQNDTAKRVLGATREEDLNDNNDSYWEKRIEISDELYNKIKKEISAKK